MNKYRIGYQENLLGCSRYVCQKKRFGIWWDDESFSKKEDLIKYADLLKKNGNYVTNINIKGYD